MSIKKIITGLTLSMLLGTGLKVAITAFFVWSAWSASNNTILLSDVAEINHYKEFVFYIFLFLVTVVISFRSQLTVFHVVCASIIALCGGYKVYDIVDKSIVDTHKDFGDAGMISDKVRKYIEDVVPKK